MLFGSTNICTPSKSYTLSVGDGLALAPLCRQPRMANPAAAPEGLELRVFDDAAGIVDLDLQLHHIAAFRRADHTGADVSGALVQGTDVARIVVVIENLI